MVAYWYVEPEVPGQLGKSTGLDRSVHPPVVSSDPDYGLEYQFADWLEDALIESFPVLLATAPLADDLVSRAMIELHPVPVTATADPGEMDVSRLPRWRWLHITGHPYRDHMGLSADHQLIVSQHALDLLHRHGIDHAAVESAM